MANKDAVADFIVSWDKMTTNVAKNAAELPPIISEYNAPLLEVLTEFRAMGAAKDARRAVKQQEVKDSAEMQKKALKLAARVRRVLIAHFGPDSELLLTYGIPPRRPRKRKQGQPETPPPEGKSGRRKSADQASEGPTASQAAEQPKPENPAPAPQSNPASKTV